MNTSRLDIVPLAMKEIRKLRALASVLMAFALSGCATTPEQTAERFNLAEVALENANLIANNLHSQGRISETDWPKVRAGLDAAAEDVAKAMAANEADPDLDVFRAVLGELNRRLVLMEQRPSEPIGEGRILKFSPGPRGKP